MWAEDTPQLWQGSQSPPWGSACAAIHPACCAREMQLSFLQTELSRGTALCGGTKAVPSKWRLREVSVLLLALFSGLCVSRQDPSDVLPSL